MNEEAIVFACDRQCMIGVLSTPAAPCTGPRVAVLIVVGGPQYRVGSHRQFVSLARALAHAGYPALRFDYRGMGDSDGAMRTFEQAQADVAAALQQLRDRCPGHGIVVWGLCDAASAALMFTTDDPSVVGIVAANPWARSAASLAATHVKHYYRARLMEREFWLKLLRGGLDLRASFASLGSSLGRLLERRPRNAGSAGAEIFQTRMARGLRRFAGHTLLVLSGNDLTAKEFLHYAATDPAWDGILALPALRRIDVPDADHTFSRREWQNQVERETVAWLRSLTAKDMPRSSRSSTTDHSEGS